MIVLITCIAVIIVGCSEKQDVQPEKNDQKTTTSNQKKVIAQNLDEPWEIQLVNNTFYISERTGSIVTIKSGEQSKKNVSFEKEISSQPEAGLLGIAMPANFVETKEAFAYYSYPENGEYFQRVIKIKETSNTWEEIEVLLDKIPGGKFHQGGRIAIGPEDGCFCPNAPKRSI